MNHILAQLTNNDKSMATRGASSISQADTYEAIGEFWDAHDFTDYDDPAMPDVEFKCMNSDTFDIKSRNNQAPFTQNSMVHDGY
ncbi:MAG TPA: hypothetical protein VL334_07215 [Anaerolineae bacterium]|nr:hypothetical protein [Anaerolineae bacterium]